MLLLLLLLLIKFIRGTIHLFASIRVEIIGNDIYPTLMHTKQLSIKQVIPLLSYTECVLT